jgi:outer membrane protein OmpA-like peptidoglycan-associated protein
MKALTSALRTAAAAFTLLGIAAAHAGEAADDRGEASRQSDVGVVTGLTVGALAAGPVGAVVGAGAGALIGDGFHRQQKAREALAQKLQKSEAERARLVHNVAELDGSLSQAQARSAQLDATLQHADQLSLNVSFRTDDDSVTAQAMSPLLKLGALVASMPEARVQVEGYADPRGPDVYNDKLSLRRAESVAAVLACAGVPREHILIEGHGRTEAASAAGDLDDYALERRVTVRLQLPGSAQVASRD